MCLSWIITSINLKVKLVCFVHFLRHHYLVYWVIVSKSHLSNAAVNGHLELPLLKDRQRFDAISTSNLEVYKFRDRWIVTYFISEHGESSPNNWSMVNLKRTWVLLFYYFLCLKVNLDLEKNNEWTKTVNLHPTLFPRWWILTHLFWKEVNWWWILT